MSQDNLMKFDPATGQSTPFPSHAQQYRDYHGKVAWLYNPWFGTERTPEDIGSDVFGFGIISELPLKAAKT